MSDRWITETAQVLSQEDGALWVAAERASACAACSAKKGCGTSLLAKAGSEQVVVRALLPEHLNDSVFVAGETIELAVDRLAFVRVALLMYLMPLVGLVLAVLAARAYGDAWTAIAALLGLFVAGWLSSFLLKRGRDSQLLQPVVLGRASMIADDVQTQTVKMVSQAGNKPLS